MAMPHAERLEGAEPGERLRRVAHDDALRDLERQPRRSQPGGGEHVAHVVDERRLLELPPRDVHAHPGRLAARRRRPRRRGAARLGEHPAAERHDEPHLLRQRDEVERRDEPALRMVPAEERLGTHGARRAEGDDRLVEQTEVRGARVVGRGDVRGGERQHGGAQVGLELQPGEGALLHGALEVRVLVAAARLGGVHRHVGVAQERARVVVGSGHGHADARRDEHLARALDAHRRADHGEHALGGHVGLLARAHVLEQHGELVAAEARHRVALAHGLAQPVGHRDEHGVADAVPQPVVDEPEAVEIDEQRAHATRIASGAGNGVGEAVVEEGAGWAAR
jgi:hypothetical protein